MQKHFGNTSFEYTEGDSVYRIGQKQVLFVMKDDPMALAEFKKARTNSTLGSIMGFTGEVLIIVPVVSALTGGEPEWLLAAGGAALILGSIPLNKAFKHHAMNAMDIYNKKHTSFRPRTEYYLSGAGARVVIRF
ncbi:MAG: hypothetical protein WDN75_00035 [Bacteroidota bacterium]